MSSNLDVFQISGPVHLSSINWSCPEDQRVVVASLVNATYILEHDRVERRVGPEALAPAWWQHFHFECIESLKDQYDHSIIGSIYEFKPPFSPDPSAPRFIVTFRGTMTDPRHFIRDGFLDVGVIFGGINKSSRVEAAIDAIDNVMVDSDTQSIWLGGHSLGASIATVTGKYMAKSNIHLQTFLFNPPFASIPLDVFSKLDTKLKNRLRIYKTVLKGGVSLFMKNHRMKSREEFSKLSNWTPFLFVNPDDLISASYIQYFEKRKKMKGKIMGFVEKVATHTSVREVCCDVLGVGLEMPNLLPSARLAVNVKKLNNVSKLNKWLESHGLHQWWQPDICLELSDHHYQTQEE